MVHRVGRSIYLGEVSICLFFSPSHDLDEFLLTDCHRQKSNSTMPMWHRNSKIRF